MCVTIVSRPMKINTFLEKNGETQNGLLIFLPNFFFFIFSSFLRQFFSLLFFSVFSVFFNFLHFSSFSFIFFHFLFFCHLITCSFIFFHFISFSFFFCHFLSFSIMFFFSSFSFFSFLSFLSFFHFFFSIFLRFSSFFFIFLSLFLFSGTQNLIWPQWLHDFLLELSRRSPLRTEQTLNPQKGCSVGGWIGAFNCGDEAVIASGQNPNFSLDTQNPNPKP